MTVSSTPARGIRAAMVGRLAAAAVAGALFIGAPVAATLSASVTAADPGETYSNALEESPLAGEQSLPGESNATDATERRDRKRSSRDDIQKFLDPLKSMNPQI